MSLTRQIFFGAAASWFSRGVAIILGLVLLPVLFRTLPKEELGIWLLLGQSWATLGILDFGFGVTLTRQIAFAKGRSGSDPSIELNEETRVEIADLLVLGLRIYRVLALLAFTVSFGLGFVYLRSLTLETVALPSVWTAWGILCLSQGLIVWATPWTCLLQGVGYVGWDAILASFVNVFTLSGQIIAALCGGGLVSLAVIASCGALTQWAVILGFARHKRPELFQLRGVWRGDVFFAMLPLTGRAWLTAIGGSLILYTDQIVIASLQGAAELPAFRAAWVLIHNINVVATTFGVASGIFVSHLWQAKDVKQVHRLLERNLRLGWLTMLTGALVMLFSGQSLITLWLGPGNFVGYPILSVFLLTSALGAQSYIISCASRATGNESFAWVSLGSGGLKLALSVLLAHQYGLLGVALGTLIALLLTSDWYYPWKGLQVLRYSRWSLVRRIIIPLVAYFAVIVVVLMLLQRVNRNLEPLYQVSMTCIISMGAFVMGLWIFVMEQEHKHRLLHRLGWRIN